MWDIFSKILNIILGLSLIYSYLENRKLKVYEIEKRIKIKEVEIEEMKKEHLNENSKIKSRRTRYTENGPVYLLTTACAECDDRYNNKLKKLEVDLEYFKRLKKYRWIFSK